MKLRGVNLNDAGLIREEVDGESEHEVDKHLGQPAERPVPVGEGEDRSRTGRGRIRKTNGRVRAPDGRGRRTKDGADATHLEAYI